MELPLLTGSLRIGAFADLTSQRGEGGMDVVPWNWDEAMENLIANFI